MEPTSLMYTHLVRSVFLPPSSPLLFHNRMPSYSYSYSYSYASCAVTKLGNGFQAEILAQYKPSINATLLIRDLKQVEDTAAKALQYFNSTRHTIFYYEDMVKNRTVRQTKPLRLKPHLGSSLFLHIKLNAHP